MKRRGIQSRHFTGSGNHSFYRSEGGGGLGPLCIVEGCGNHTSGRGITGMCQSCAARKTLIEVVIPNIPADERRRRAVHALGFALPAARIANKAIARAMSSAEKKDQTARARAAMAAQRSNQTAECRAEFSRKMSAIGFERGRQGGKAPRQMIRHIPDGRELHEDRSPHGSEPLGLWRTYCGRMVPTRRCIDIQRDCIEHAECKACQRVDDARQVRQHRAECRAAGVGS